MSVDYDDSQVQRRLEKIQRNAPEVLAAALWQGAQDIIRLSVPKVPVDTGRLQGAWVVDAPEEQGHTIAVVIGYGTHYALYVHERTDVSHAVGQAKFLEEAIKESSGDFLNKMVRRSKPLLKGKGPGIKPRKSTGDDYDGGVV